LCGGVCRGLFVAGVLGGFGVLVLYGSVFLEFCVVWGGVLCLEGGVLICVIRFFYRSGGIKE